MFQFEILNEKTLNNEQTNTSTSQDQNQKESAIRRKWHFKTYHPDDLIIGKPEDRIRTKSSFREQSDMALIFEMEPKTIEKLLQTKVGF